jgi:hypothetical protein
MKTMQSHATVWLVSTVLLAACGQGADTEGKPSGSADSADNSSAESLGAVLGEQQVDALPKNPSQSDETFQPAMDYDKDGCYPASAIDATGKLNPGLKTTGAVNGSCHDASDLANDNMYARTRCDANGWCAHMYGLYFEKDQSVVGSGHRHDWEHIIVWVKDSKPEYVSVSQHGGFKTRPMSEVRFQDTHPKIVYHKDGGLTHDFRFATEGDEPPENDTHQWHFPALVSWNGYPATVRDKLNNADFGSATAAFRDKPCSPSVPESSDPSLPLPTYPAGSENWQCFSWNLYLAHDDSLFPFQYLSDYIAPGQPDPNDPVVSNGGGGSGGDPAVGAQMAAVASYIFPTEEDWTRLIASPTNKVSLVVANVLNGPDSAVNSDWAKTIKNAQAQQKRVLGYVRTGYLSKSTQHFPTRLGSTDLADWIAQIEQDVNGWYDLYGSIDGIFFDEGFNECGDGNQYAEIYSQLNQYVKHLHPHAITVLNPGSIVPQCYEPTADILLTFEGKAATYMGSSYSPLTWTPQNASKIWHIIHTADEADIGKIAKLARDRHAGYLQITSDFGDNPYDTLPPVGYWTKVLNEIAGGTPSVADALDGTGGAPQPPSGLTILDPSVLDYTSIKVAWTPSQSGAARYRVYVDGKHVASIPASLNRVAIGGVDPGRTVQVYVTAEGSKWGAESTASNTISASTLALPHGIPIENVRVSVSGETAVYSADFLMPYSFRRLFVLADPADNTADCWAINTPTSYVCAVYMVENGSYFKYSGVGHAKWTWSSLGTVEPSVSNYTYTWTVPLGPSPTPKANRNLSVIQGQGYGPFSNVFPPTLAN